MTNGAAIGYAILASKRLGLTNEQIIDLDRLMSEEMDFTSEEEAKEVYNKNF